MTRSFASVSGPAVGADPISAKLVVQPGLSRLARGWLWLGLLALAGSGVFAVLLVLSRTPQLNQLLAISPRQV